MADLRAFFSAKASELSDEASMYKLASIHTFWSFSNCKILNLNFTKGEYEENLLFQPLNEMKPIVIACHDSNRSCNFFVLDSHLTNEKEKGMINFKPFKSEEYLVLCSSKKYEPYWSIRNNDQTFFYSGYKFTRHENTYFTYLDTLCAFVGGEITIKQLRTQSYLATIEKIKKIRREEHIRGLQIKLAYTEKMYGEMFAGVFNNYSILNEKLLLLRILVDSSWPTVNKKRILKILEK